MSSGSRTPGGRPLSPSPSGVSPAAGHHHHPAESIAHFASRMQNHSPFDTHHPDRGSFGGLYEGVKPMDSNRWHPDLSPPHAHPQHPPFGPPPRSLNYPGMSEPISDSANRTCHPQHQHLCHNNFSPSSGPPNGGMPLLPPWTPTPQLGSMGGPPPHGPSSSCWARPPAPPGHGHGPGPSSSHMLMPRADSLVEPARELMPPPVPWEHILPVPPIPREPLAASPTMPPSAEQGMRHTLPQHHPPAPRGLIHEQSLVRASGPVSWSQDDAMRGAQTMTPQQQAKRPPNEPVAPEGATCPTGPARSDESLAIHGLQQLSGGSPVSRGGGGGQARHGCQNTMSVCSSDLWDQLPDTERSHHRRNKSPEAEPKAPEVVGCVVGGQRRQRSGSPNKPEVVRVVSPKRSEADDGGSPSADHVRKAAAAGRRSAARGAQRPPRPDAPHAAVGRARRTAL